MSQRIGKSNGNDTTGEHVIDFASARNQRLEEKRRNTERIFFKNLISVYSVLGESKLIAIELIDVSETGISFQIPYKPDSIWPKKANELPVRLYFSQDTFLEIQVKIENSRSYIENQVRYVRFGCSIDPQLPTYPTFRHFVEFLKLYAEHARKDLGDSSVFYL